MTKSPAFQFYPKDWLTDINVILMTPTQRGGYIQILCHLWLSPNLTLPLASLSQLSGLNDEDLNTVITSCLTVLENGGVKVVTHKRLQAEFEKQVEYKNRKSEAGKRGMEARYKAKKKQPNSVRKVLVTKSNSSSSIPSSNINTSNEVLQDEPEKNYGNPEINKMIIALKGKIGIDAFADSSIERNMGKHCVTLMEKIGVKEFARRLDIILSDSFKRKNCNRIKYVYNEIKAFMEPKTEDSKIAFIS